MLKSTNIRVLFLKTVSLYSRATSFFSVRQESLQKVDIISYSILKNTSCREWNVSQFLLPTQILPEEKERFENSFSFVAFSIKMRCYLNEAINVFMPSSETPRTEVWGRCAGSWQRTCLESEAGKSVNGSAGLEAERKVQTRPCVVLSHVLNVQSRSLDSLRMAFKERTIFKNQRPFQRSIPKLSPGPLNIYALKEGKCD